MIFLIVRKITKYAIPNYIYVVNGVNIPFKLFIIHNNKYLFVTNNNKEEIDILQNKIKLLKYDMNNLIELKTEDMFNMTDPMHDNFIIINNKYYK